jgi:hypothetical protein
LGLMSQEKIGVSEELYCDGDLTPENGTD